MERRIRQSQLAMFRKCRRAWELEYIRGIELARAPGVTKGARDLGTLVHYLAETYYNGGDWRETLRARHDAVLAEGEWSGEWAEFFELANIMFEGYVDWLETTAADDGESIVMVEPQLETVVGDFHGDTVILTGKPDLVKYNDFTGQYILDDTKTVTRIDTVLVHAPQLLTYAMILKLEHGIDISIGRTNQLRKVKRTARANPPFYGRPSMFIGVDRLRHHWSQVNGQLDEMVKLMQYFEERGDSERTEYDRLFYPSPAPMNCIGCDFAAVCQTMDDGDHNYVIRNHYRPKPITVADGEVDASE